MITQPVNILLKPAPSRLHPKGMGFWARFWSRSNERIGYLFILPSLLHLLVFAVGPMVFSLYLSFHRWTGPNFQDAPFIGLRNYLFLLEDGHFWHAMVNTLEYTLLAVPLGMAASLLMALAIDMKLRGQSIFRMAFFLPVVTSWVAVSVVWITLLDPQAGIVNYGLHLLDLPGVDWLGDPNWAMLTIVVITIWKSAGFSMIIWLAGLQAIPPTVYEAGALDGATGMQRFWYLTLPLLAPTSIFLAITGVISALQVFGPVYVMTKGGPLEATDVVVYRIYERAFADFKMGYASSMAWVLFVCIFAVTALQLWYSRRHGEAW